jgi:RNA polymerase sigma-70 factor (ECF subfamily)
MPQDVITEDEDRELLAAIAGGDEAAFQSFYRRHSPLVFALSKRIIGREHDAEDVVADVFWELWNKSARYCPSKASPSTYLVMLTRCRALDRKRGMSRRETPAILAWLEHGGSLAGAVDTPPEEQSIAAEHRQLIARAVGELDSNLREPIELAFFDGLTHKDTAESLGIPLGTAKARIRTALARLRQVLRANRID